MAVNNNTERFYLMQAEQEQMRIDTIAKLLEPKIKELLPDEKAVYRIAAAMAENMKAGKIKSMEVCHSPIECCDVVTFKLYS